MVFFVMAEVIMSGSLIAVLGEYKTRRHQDFYQFEFIILVMSVRWVIAKAENSVICEQYRD